MAWHFLDLYFVIRCYLGGGPLTWVILIGSVPELASSLLHPWWLPSLDLSWLVLSRGDKCAWLTAGDPSLKPDETNKNKPILLSYFLPFLGGGAGWRRGCLIIKSSQFSVYELLTKRKLSKVGQNERKKHNIYFWKKKKYYFKEPVQKILRTTLVPDQFLITLVHLRTSSLILLL